MPVCRRILAAIALAVLIVGSGVGTVSAEVLDTRPFIMRLFGLGKAPEAPPPAPSVNLPGTTKVIRVPANMPPRQTVPAQPVVHPKNADARVVLVFGDRLAADLGRGLEVAFADSPDVIIEVKSVEPSGLTNRQTFDWKGWLDTRLASGKRPAAALAMLGLSDAEAIETGSATVEYPSADWETIYRARIDELINAFAGRAIPLHWVGLAPVADTAATADLSYIDSLIRSEASERGATYVDIWEGFAAAGAFSFNGPDMDGQARQLRLKDGIGFSRSGARKLAFFAEQDLRRSLGTTAGAMLDSVSPNGLVVLLNDPSAASEDQLASPADVKGPKPGTPLYRLVVAGEPLDPVAGRADDLVSMR